MPNLTKRDLVERISKDTGMVQHDVRKVIQKTLDYLADSLIQGKTVELRNFGVFKVKLHKARIGRNPKRPRSDVRIPPRFVVKFKPGMKLKAEVLAFS